MNFKIKCPDNSITFPNGRTKFKNDGWTWKWSKSKVKWALKNDFIEFRKSSSKISGWSICYKNYLKVNNKNEPIDRGAPYKNIILNILNAQGNTDLKSLFNNNIFSNPKPLNLISFLIKLLYDDFIILDFFAGSGTTGHAVMQLNAEDGGNRRFILCQIDEPIKEDKPAYQFCKDHDLEPVISSITIERLRRAGEKIKAETEEARQKQELFEDNEKILPDIGFKVFDTIPKPALELEEGKIIFKNTENDPLSRIYNMIFSVGIDPPTAPLECVKEECIYRIGNHYYITQSEKVTHEDLALAIHAGKVFIDGWTASINATLQHYKEDVKIVF